MLPKLLIFAPPPGADLRFRYAPVASDGRIGTWQAATLAQLPKSPHAWLVLPATSVLMVRIRLPKLSPAKLAQVLPFAVEDRVVGDPANLHAACAAAVDDGLRLTAVVDRAWLIAIARQLAEGGIGLRAAVSETQLLPPRREWRVLFTAHDPTSPVLITPNAETIVLDQPTSTPPAALQLALAKAGDRPTLRLMADTTDAGVPLEAWASDWANALGIDVVADGEALLDGVVSAQNRLINLLTGLDAELATGPGLGHVLQPAAWVAGLALLIHGSLLVIDNLRLAAREDALRASIAQSFSTSFPNAAVVDPALQMRRNVAALRASVGEASSTDFLPSLSRASAENPQPWQRVDYRDGKLEVIPLQAPRRP